MKFGDATFATPPEEVLACSRGGCLRKGQTLGFLRWLGGNSALLRGIASPRSLGTRFSRAGEARGRMQRRIRDTETTSMLHARHSGR